MYVGLFSDNDDCTGLCNIGLVAGC